MSEIEIKLQNVDKRGFGLRVIKGDSPKGGLIVKEISAGSAASKTCLKIGDRVVKVNNKSVKSSRSKILSEINDSKLNCLSLFISRDECRHQSDMNLSTSVSSISNNIQIFRNSKSSTDLNFVNSKNVTHSNFVPDESIADYIEEINDSSTALPEGYRSRNPSLFHWENNSSLASLNDLRDDRDSPQNTQQSNNYTPPSPTPVQVTRKKAYKKIIDEVESLYQAQPPKVTIKRATNISATKSISEKYPVYVVKKKITSSENRNVSANLANKNRYSSSSTPKTSVSNAFINLNNSSNAKYPAHSPNGVSPLSQSYDLEDGNAISSISKSSALLSSPNQPPALRESPQLSGPVELEVKFFTFKEKIYKPVWKKYTVEEEVCGIIFQCNDITQSEVSLNSTALTPSIVNPELIMRNWNVNNTISRFYLPIGLPDYDSSIIRTATSEEIRIIYNNFKLEFIINLQKLNTSSHPGIFKLLRMELPEPKLPPVKHKKSISGQDHNRIEIKKIKQPKIVEYLLSSLHKTKKVEGVPLVVIICVDIVESCGQTEEGVYRKSGNVLGRKALEEAVTSESPEKWSGHDEWTNVHTVSSFFKSILRKYILFDKDTAIKLSSIKLDMDETRNSDAEKKVQEIMDMFYHLCNHFKSHSSAEENKCRFDTFKYIIKHLYRMSLYEKYTKMNADNLAMCFMPTLFEDIPSDDDIDYKESKKNVIHENLKKMVGFWITYADIVCEFLEEEKQEELNRKVVHFLKRSNIIGCDQIKDIDDCNRDIAAFVKERIEFYTESVVTEGSGYSSPISTNTPESYFTKVKNSRLYQSVKQPRKSEARRRRNSGSSVDLQKSDLEGTSNNQKTNLSKAGVGSPSITKKIEPWQTKNVKKKKDGPLVDSMHTVPITNLLISDLKKDVPLVVVACIQLIEKFGLLTDGVYRISGKNQDISILDSYVMSNETDKWIQESSLKIWGNMHNTACLLKKVLKKFCLIPKDTWMHMTSQFSEKLEPEDVKKVLKAAAYYLRVEQSKFNVISNLGKTDGEDHKSDVKQCEVRFRSGTLRYVLQHLKHVSMHEAHNRMTSNSLAVCFVPVLMEEDYSSDMIVINLKCIQIVQLLIDHCNWIFQWDGRPSEDLYGQKMSNDLEEYLKEYKPKTCVDRHNIDYTYIPQPEEIKKVLSKFIQSSFHFSDCSDSLRMYFDNMKITPTVYPDSVDL